jgi:hypothetical protein
LNLRKEREPRFVERRALFSRRYRVCAGSGRDPRCFEFSAREFRRLHAEVTARGIARVGEVGRETLWWTGGEDLFWADDELSGEDVALLVWDRARRQDARLQRLRKIRAREERVVAARRERIPAEVRAFVWRRDDGRCVNCGSEDDLQFDHLIPWSRGGGNGVENIQILCGICNREKGDAVE